MEAALHALTPAVLDYTVNGRVQDRVGNDDPSLRPHGVYPSEGDDRWIAIACEDDDQRVALAELVGGIDDDSIRSWTATRGGDDAMYALQAVGVPAHVVADSADFAQDPQIAYRGHLVTFDHPMMGDVVIEGPRFVLSRTPARATAPGPMLGQHTTEVLADILGYDDDKVVELVLSGALE